MSWSLFRLRRRVRVWAFTEAEVLAALAQPGVFYAELSDA